jgi:hypothetical protein
VATEVGATVYLAMTSLVLELQSRAQQSDAQLPELLRRAKVLASKLGIDEARGWIDLETDGYPEGAILPSYRVLPCELRAFNIARGEWQPMRWDESNILQQYFSLALMRDPIALVQEYARGKNVQQAELTQDDVDHLLRLGNEHMARVRMARFFSRANFVGILEGVRTKILDWTLALEKRGVLGDGMTFDESDRQRAAEVVFRIGDASAVVLFLSANPDPDSPLQVEKQQSRIVKVRNGSRHQRKIRIESLPDLDLAEFAKSLRLHSPSVLHFSGHGDRDGSLLMRDHDGAQHKMHPSGLARLIALHKGTLRLVVLNACHSRELADSLLRDIDCVIGMTSAVSDDAAILFAEAFYGALFDGQSIGDAFATSAAVVGARYHKEADTPVLKTRVGLDANRMRLVD